MRIVYDCFSPQFNLAHVKNKPVIFRHPVDMWFIHRGRPSVNKPRILSLRYLCFFFQTLMKEMQGNLRILKQLKDFDERKSQEIAARAYQEQEIMKLKVVIKAMKM